MSHPRPFFIALTLLAALALVAAPIAGAQTPADADAYTPVVVLGDPQDAYWPLAGEIAQAEGAPLAASIAEALQHAPIHLLWVISPGSLSDEALVSVVGVALRAYGAVSLGVISGATLDSARALWQRRADYQGNHLAVVPREERIELYRAGELAETWPLAGEALAAALPLADYVSYQGHGTRSMWHLAEDDEFTADRVPDLPPLVVNAGSCQTFRLWSEGSIALSFADHGAAAYAGFPHSPMGFLMGEPKGYPWQRTWPEFPIGHVVQVQNRGLMQGLAAWPYYLLLGDPRQALQTEAPYRVAGDTVENGVRVVTLADAPAGVLPVRIPDGATYGYVRVAGVGVAWRGDPFYDADVQMADIGADKFLLLAQDGGDVVIRLSARPSLGVRLTEPLVDALDHTALVFHAVGNREINFILLGIAILLMGWRLWRRREHWRADLVAALLAALALTIFRGVYAVARQPRLAWLYEGYLRTMGVEFQVNALYLVIGLVVSTSGCWLYLGARRIWGKLIGGALALMPTVFMAPFLLANMLLLNTLASQKYGLPLYGYSLGLMTAITLALEALVLGGVLWLARRRRRAAT